MQCPLCGVDNPEHVRFCGQCGSSLSRTCSVCGASNPFGFRFCGSCGAPLQSAPAPRDAATRRVEGITGVAPAPVEGPSAADAMRQVAERRQITVMFCDLVGSTALSALLDPEELRELLQAYQLTCAGVIERLEGYVAQYLGDGILAYFGYPVAYDNEAGRAVRAALEIVEQIRAMRFAATDRIGRDLAVRIGLHSGVVVISEVGGGQRREHLALGEVPNIAARLQSLAAPNTVLLSETTYRLVSREYLAEDLGAQEIKGLARQERAYRVVQERRGSGSSEIAGPAARPLVGRDRELEALYDRWTYARGGKGQVVVINGDAGIGKSRLIHSFLERVGAEPHVLLEGRALPYYRNTAFYPVIDLLRRLINCGPEQTPRTSLSALKEALERDGLAESESMPVFSSLLFLPESAPAPPARRSTRERRKQTRAAMLQMLAKTAARQPVVMILEDLHWADPSTLDFVDYLIGEVAGVRALLILTHRPEFRFPLDTLPHVASLTLHRLARPQIESIIAGVTEGKQLPPQVLEQIVQKTDGVPLFVEELTKMVMESGLLQINGDHLDLSGPLPPLAIPSTLQDSLEARLDRLATTKDLAQLGATLGREFSYTLLHAVSGLEETLLRRSLAQLVDAELLQQRGVPPQATYTFRHALIQDAAYQSLLKSSRQQYHHRIARVLEERFPDLVAAEPERLAQHYMAASLPEQALEKWLQAGLRAVERSAHQEAIAHLEQARALIDRLPATPDRARQELELHLALGPALIATLGYTALEVRDTYLRAATICEQDCNPGTYFHVLCGLFSTYFVQLELEQARRYAQRLLRLAEETRRRDHRVGANTAMGIALVRLGQVRSGRDYLARALGEYDSAEHFALAYSVGQDFGVVALAHEGLALWALGYPDQARDRTRDALALARTLQHPHTLAFALAFVAITHFLRREPEPVLEATAELLALAEREGFRHWTLHAVTFDAWARIEQGEPEEGLNRLDRVPAMLVSDGTYLHDYLQVRAIGLARLGKVKEALRLVEATYPSGEQRARNHWREAIMCRLHGELLCLQPGSEAEAEQRLRQALASASAEGMRMLELRAATTLAQLLRGTERGKEARRVLRDVYDTFAEGLTLPDLQDARQQLEQPLLAPA